MFCRRSLWPTAALVFCLSLAVGLPAAATEPIGRVSFLEAARDALAVDEDQRPQEEQPFGDARGFDGTIGTFDLASAVRQSMLMLTVQHSARMLEDKTRRELGGPFLRDYVRSVRGLKGWHDGDSWATNYIGHPSQGAVSGYIQIQNDGTGRAYEFGRSRAYWKSRLQAFAWSAAYSTQFELGPYSEATIGNVGLHSGTMGLVDLVVTPVGGVSLIVLEDALDTGFIKRWEGGSPLRARLLRSLLTPNRAMANALRGQALWHRDTRPVPPRQKRPVVLTPIEGLVLPSSAAD